MGPVETSSVLQRHVPDLAEFRSEPTTKKALPRCGRQRSLLNRDLLVFSSLRKPEEDLLPKVKLPMHR